MGTTSDKLTYLNTTKQKLKESINALGGDITSETTFRNYVTELDNIYDNLPKTTGEGSNLSLTTIKGRINVDDILGDTQQYKTNGYNLFNINGETSAGTLEKYNNGFTLRKSTNRTIRFELPQTLSSGTYTLSIKHITKVTTQTNFLGVNVQNYNGTSWDNVLTNQYINGNTSITLTISGQFNGLYFFMPSGESDTAMITIDNVMLETGSTAHSYEPYTNGVSPNPTYPQDINVVTGQQEVLVRGKNLFDRANATENIGLKWADGQTFTASTTSYLIGNYMYLGGITQIASNYNFFIFYYDKDKNYLGQGPQVRKESYGGYVKTTTIPYSVAPDICYARIEYRPQDNNSEDMTTKQDIMLNIGTTASAWQPYQSQTKIVNLSSKNKLVPINYNRGSVGGITWTMQNGLITASGTCTSITQSVTTSNVPSGNWTTLPSGTYTLSGGTSQVRLQLMNSNGTNIAYDTGTGTTFTTTEDKQVYYRAEISSGVALADTITLYPMLVEGSSPSTYEPYYNYELGGIGTYKNRIFKAVEGNSVYDSLSNEIKATLTIGKRYREKNIGKYTFTGNETWKLSQTADVFYDETFSDNIMFVDENIPYCDILTGVIRSSGASGMANKPDNTCAINSGSGTAGQRLYVKTTTYTTVGALQTGMKGHSVYWIYATPTYEEITNETLIEELNELEKMMSYNGQTNISVSGNLPMILSVSALKGESE